MLPSRSDHGNPCLNAPNSNLAELSYCHAAPFPATPAPAVLSGLRITMPVTHFSTEGLRRPPPLVLVGTVAHAVTPMLMTAATEG
jgi:hypothetical protein